MVDCAVCDDGDIPGFTDGCPGCSEEDMELRPEVLKLLNERMEDVRKGNVISMEELKRRLKNG